MSSARIPSGDWRAADCPGAGCGEIVSPWPLAEDRPIPADSSAMTALATGD
jgi:hypothetical protein